MEKFLRAIWNEASKAAGIEVECYQGTRHSFITQAIESGWREDDVRSQVGHLTKDAIRHYDHSKKLKRLRKARGME